MENSNETPETGAAAVARSTTPLPAAPELRPGDQVRVIAAESWSCFASCVGRVVVLSETPTGEPIAYVRFPKTVTPPLAFALGELERVDEETPERRADRVMRPAAAEGRPAPVVGVDQADDELGELPPGRVTVLKGAAMGKTEHMLGSVEISIAAHSALYDEGRRRLHSALAPLAVRFDRLTLRQRVGLHKAADAVLRRTVSAELLRRGPLELVTIGYLLADIVRRVAGMTELALAIYLGEVAKIPELDEIRDELVGWPDGVAT